LMLLLLLLSTPAGWRNSASPYLLQPHRGVRRIFSSLGDGHRRQVFRLRWIVVLDDK
jgi:hypothetical protein